MKLTTDAVALNPANYSAWHHRRTLLKALNTDLGAEMAYCRAVIEENPKNYQVWQHRRALVEWTQDPSKELCFTEMILSQDAKNYHAWQHRQWAIQTFQLFDNELAYTERLLEEDIRNNSAWNQRFFVITSPHNEPLKLSRGGDSVLSGKLLDDEINFTLKAITGVPGNESAWNYLRGLIEHSDEPLVGAIKDKVKIYCEEFLKSRHDEVVTFPYLMAMLVDLYKETGSSESSAKALQMCKDLAEKHDKIRSEYWDYIAGCIQQPE